MKKNGILVFTALLALVVAFLAQRAVLQDQVEELASRVAEVEAGILPVHARCKSLEIKLADRHTEIAEGNARLAALSKKFDEQINLRQRDLQRMEELEKGLLKNRGMASSDLAAAHSELGFRLTAIGEVAAEQAKKLALRTSSLEQQARQLPVGTVVAWFSNGRPLPAGWAICDGSQSTPDLRGRFLRGVGRLDEAGYSYAGAKMEPAGVHGHRSTPIYSYLSMYETQPQNPGTGLVLVDTGILNSDAPSLAAHGSHIHKDAHIPAHVTVVYIIKMS